MTKSTKKRLDSYPQNKETHEREKHRPVSGYSVSPGILRFDDLAPRPKDAGLFLMSSEYIRNLFIVQRGIMR
jgi:hypothetical protein